MIEDSLVYKATWDLCPLPILIYDLRRNLISLNKCVKDTFCVNSIDDLKIPKFKEILSITVEEEDKLSNVDSIIREAKILHNTGMSLSENDESNMQYYSITTSKISDTNVGTVGYIKILENVTERYQIKEVINEIERRSEESDKLKSCVLANISHEIRTPLNAIVGFSELILDADSYEKQLEYMKYIYNNNEQLLRIINDILDLARIDVGYTVIPKRCDFSECFNEFANSFKSDWQNPNVEFIVENPFKKIIADIDWPRIAQVLTNYVTNAIKFTQSGSITMGYSYHSGIMEVYVKDTGIGIPEDKKHLIFKRFQKIDEFTPGAGLGLAIVKALMSPFNVECGFDSTYGKGSYFWARGPLVMTEIEIEDCEAEDLENTSVIDFYNQRELKILIAEDNDTNYTLISEMLKPHITHRAINGHDAIYRAKADTYDIMLVNKLMPILDGVKAVSVIRTFDKTTSIIVFSPDFYDTENRMGIEDVSTSFLTKPIKRKLLIEKINQLLTIQNSFDLKCVR